jgi:hypothetical protein
MHASECRAYAEQCLQLARHDLAPTHRQVLLEMAAEWRKVAEELLDTQKELFSNTRMDE